METRPPVVVTETEQTTEPNADPWRHRSLSMRCQTCMFWVVKKTDRTRDISCDTGPIGRCRQSSPTMKGWPAVFAMDWCGDHKVDENKI